MARLYQFLVRLHPCIFRKKFGSEMLCIFDETDSALRPALFADCLISLMRQWVLRAGYWILAVAGLAAFAQVVLIATMWLTITPKGISTLVSDALSANGSLPTGETLLLASGVLTAMLLSLTMTAAKIGKRPSSTHKSPRRRVGVHK